MASLVTEQLMKPAPEVIIGQIILKTQKTRDIIIDGRTLRGYPVLKQDEAAPY